MAETDREARLLTLAEHVADGDGVDWEAAERELTDSQPSVRNLRVVASIGQAHRNLLLDELPFRAWGTLDLERHLRSGGFGEVYLAHDRNLDRPVALKLLADDDDAGASTEFVKEARRLAKVRHDNVVTVHGVDRHEGRLGIWMEWIDGDSLDHLVHDLGTMGAREAAVVGLDLCRALAAVHAAGLVHRDVKLANVVRERGGRYVLMDFGSSSRKRDGRGIHDSGTPAYMPPELFEGLDSGEQTDIYALGVLLYRLVTGDYPIEGRDFGDLQRTHRERRLVPVRDRNPNLPGDFIQVVERAMAPDPADRFRSAGEMERALAACVGSETTSPAPAPAPPWWRAPALWATAAIVLVAVTALVVQRAWFAPLAAEATFFRWAAEGVEERLRDGLTVEPGDQVFLELETESRTWLYVVNADAAGAQYLLFPVEGLEIENPLPPGTHRIPGADAMWDVTSAGGRETLLVVASRRPVELIENGIEGLEPPAPGFPIRLAEPEVTTRLRGFGGLSERPGGTDSKAPSPMEQFRRGVTVETGGRRGVRVWELTLSNPRSTS